jgi:hypothetical protein
MNKIDVIKPVLAFVGVFVFTYLIGVFVAWEMNPANWTTDGRFAASLVGTFLGFKAAQVVAERQTYYE